MKPTRYANGTKAISKDGAVAAGKTSAELASSAQQSISHSDGTHSATSKDRHSRISEAAYRRAEARGFSPDGALDDWLLAEREVDGENPR